MGRLTDCRLKVAANPNSTWPARSSTAANSRARTKNADIPAATKPPSPPLPPPLLPRLLRTAASCSAEAAQKALLLRHRLRMRRSCAVQGKGRGREFPKATPRVAKVHSA